MNSLLTELAGRDEFVVTPELNTYIVALRITPEEAQNFGGNERISICLDILDNGNAGVRYVRGVSDDNEPNEYLAPENLESEDSKFTDGQIAVIASLEERVVTSIEGFLAEVKDDLPEYYEELNMARLAAGGSLQDILQGILKA